MANQTRMKRAVKNLTTAVLGSIQYNKKPSGIAQLSEKALNVLASTGNVTVALPAQREMQKRLANTGTAERSASKKPRRRKV